MTQSNRPAPPSVADLFKEYLNRQVEAQAEGLGYPEPAEGAVPHEAVPVQPVDPALAWKDNLASVKLLGAKASFEVPPDWPALVSGQEPAVALAFALGNFPQLVRNLHPLLSGEALALRDAGAPVNAPGLAEWAGAQREAPQRLLAAGALRLARQFEQAERLLAEDGPAAWQAVRANEQAALAWHAGQHEKALAMWQAQEESVPVLFNRGMAALFLGQTELAANALTQALAGLAETSAWYHLAALYLALARQMTR
jgi:hypothetical protein